MPTALAGSRTSQKTCSPSMWKVPAVITPGTWVPGARMPFGSLTMPGSAVAPRTLASGISKRLFRDQSLSRPSISMTSRPPSMSTRAMRGSSLSVVKVVGGRGAHPGAEVETEDRRGERTGRPRRRCAVDGGVEVAQDAGDLLGDVGIHRGAVDGGQQQQPQLGGAGDGQRLGRVGGLAEPGEQGPDPVAQVPAQGGQVEPPLAAERLVQAVAVDAEVGHQVVDGDPVVGPAGEQDRRRSDHLVLVECSGSAHVTTIATLGTISQERSFPKWPA